MRLPDLEKQSPAVSDWDLTGQPGGPSRVRIWQMFDRIARRYDLLNHLLSCGQDVVWRDRLAANLPEGAGQRILDLATGTGDVLLALNHQGDRARSTVGLDRSLQMLAMGQDKVRDRKLVHRVALLVGDASQLPFADGSYDAVTMAFGIRNVTDVERTLREAHRVLKPGGRLLILETSLPGNAVLRTAYLFYLRHILPHVGSTISGDGHAYRYLNQTIEAFPYGEEFCAYLHATGYRKVQATPLTFGVATLYRADKP